METTVSLGILETENDSEWGAPYFVQPKLKTNRVKFLSRFRNLNRQIKHKPYPMPKISTILLKLKGFKYSNSLDSNMGYYHIQLSKDISNLCNIILPWVKYWYKRLPMGVSSSLDIFQYKMNNLFQEFSFICAYIDDLLIIINCD